MGPTLRATIDAHLAIVHRGLGLRVADPGQPGWSLIVALPGEDEGRRVWVTDEPALAADELLSADAAVAADVEIATAYAERSIREQGDPWTITLGIPSGAGAAPLSGPCCPGDGL